MSNIAEKLVTVAEKIPKVYESGVSYADGIMSDVNDQLESVLYGEGEWGTNYGIDDSKIIKKTVSDTYISVDDVSEFPHSVKCKVESVNLLPPPTSNITHNGITYTINSDGTITMNGTATAASWHNFPQLKWDAEENVDMVAYMSDVIVNDAYDNVQLCVIQYDESGETIAATYLWTSKRVTISHECKRIRVDLYVKSGVTLNNVTIYPMLNKGTTALPYTPYVKPEEVKVTRCGRNICGGEAFAEKIANSVSGSVIDREKKTVTLRDTVASSFLWWDKFEPNTRYTVFLKGKNSLTTYYSDTNLACHFTDGTKENLKLFDGNNSQACWTSPAGKTISQIKGGYHAGTATFEYHYVGLFQGALTLEDFEPYNGQTLTPDASGTVEGMTSVSPYMNIFSDTEGVNIEVEYNKSWGMQTEYDRFWDAYQNYGNRTDYSYAFSGYGWTDDTLQPKYDIKPLKCEYMFANARGLVNVEAAFSKAGIVFDTSNATDFTNFLLSNITVKKMPMVDISNASGVTNLFSYALALNSVKLTVSEKAVFRDSFNQCNALSDIEIFGLIGSSVDFRWSPLNKASITNVINTLSSTVTGQTLTLKLSAVNTAFETSSGASDGSTSAEFAALVATKTNWTITMI